MSPELDRILTNLSMTCAKAYQIFVSILYSELYCHVHLDSINTHRRLFLILRTLCSNPELGLHVRRLSLSLPKQDLDIENGPDLEQWNEGIKVLNLVLAGLATDRKVLRRLWDVQTKRWTMRTRQLCTHTAYTLSRTYCYVR